MISSGPGSGTRICGARTCGRPCLVAADLAGADLGPAHGLGADFRDAGLAGADLTASLFLTRVQLDAARGDGTTKLPPSLTRPAHWDA